LAGAEPPVELMGGVVATTAVPEGVVEGDVAAGELVELPGVLNVTATLGVLSLPHALPTTITMAATTLLANVAMRAITTQDRSAPDLPAPR
ncbi:MAG: hypothetical protein QOC57_1847, partial [Ilumatobacteraceae bacterium]